jgi:hypothetical protein
MQIDERVREALERAFAAARLATVTTEEMLSALRAEGIGSYERLVEELVRAVRRAGTPPQQLGIDVLARETPSALAERVVHRVPQVPLTVDGVGIQPEEISRFDGRVLHFVAGDAESLAAFTDGRLVSIWLQISILAGIATRGTRRSRVAQQVAPPYDLEPANTGAAAGGSTRPGSGPPTGGPFYHPPDLGTPGASGMPGNLGNGAPWTTTFVLYQDIYWRGSQLVLQAGQGYSDLTEVGNGFIGSWNDQASSISSSELIGVCGEHVNFDGSRLIVLKHTPYVDLTSIGWNDRISSVYAG